MTSIDTPVAQALASKKLAGGAKNYLDDLLTLNVKTSAEMARGISDGYLDADGAVELAERLGVEPPRVKRTFYAYFTTTEVSSIQVSAYDEEQALREAQRIHETNVAYGEVHYGSRSRFNDTNGGNYRVFSQVTAERPTTQAINAVLPSPHPWELERDQMRQTNGAVTRENERTMNRSLQLRIRHDSVVDREEEERNRQVRPRQPHLDPNVVF